MKRILLALVALAAVRAAPAAAQTATPATRRVGNVLIQPAKDPINDNDHTTVSVLAERPPYMPVILTWGCADTESYDLWIHGVPFTQERMVQVTWRFDQDPPQSGQWEMTRPDYLLLNHPDDFTDAAEKAHSVAICITTASGEQQTSIFQLNGLAQAFTRVSCLKPPADDKPAPTSP